MKVGKKAPPKSRNLEKTRSTILNVTFLEVFRHGFQGVSVDDIVAKTQMTKGALYHQFPTKLDLGYALVEEVIQPMILDRWIRPLEKYDNPIDGIFAQLQKNIGDVEPALLKLGCPLNNLVQEMAPIDRGFKIRLQKALNLWIDEIDFQLKRARKKSYLKKSANTKEMAQFIVMAHEGFFGLIKGLDDSTVFPAMVESLRIFIRAHQIS